MHGEGLLRYSNGHLDEDLAVPNKSLELKGTCQAACWTRFVMSAIIAHHESCLRQLEYFSLRTWVVVDQLLIYQ